MKNEKARNRFFLLIGLIIIIMLIGNTPLLQAGSAMPTPVCEPVFDGSSRELKRTTIVPTLDAKIPKGKNVIWCASFLAGWKTLESRMLKEPISIQGSPKIATALNNATDPRPHISRDSLYVAAGWNHEGIIEKIIKDLARKFPDKPAPGFPGIRPDSFVAYSYLQANVKFALPFFQNNEPLTFIDSENQATKLSSFGLRKQDEYAYYKLRDQSEILFVMRDKEYQLTEFAIDLDRASTPDQIVLAMVEPKSTVAETIEYIDRKIGMSKKDSWEAIGPNDVLLVPDMVWSISHRFTELEGKRFKNNLLQDMPIDVAQQDIRFRLDRSGAELKSEAKLYALPIPSLYIFNRPFLLFMKKRGTTMPYFVMWIDNAELFNRWQGN